MRELRLHLVIAAIAASLLLTGTLACGRDDASGGMASSERPEDGGDRSGSGTGMRDGSGDGDRDQHGKATPKPAKGSATGAGSGMGGGDGSGAGDGSGGNNRQ